MGRYEYSYFSRYISVAERRANALLEMENLRQQGRIIEPVKIEGREIAHSFWGKSWCKHLESFSDFESRLPRGRTYARNGSVCHLAIESGKIQAIVSGSELYRINITIAKLASAQWQEIKQRCAGQIGSMLELLRGKLSDQVMTLVTHHRCGLFPKPDQIKLVCSCPDWATMCKHVAAVLYGVGNRLDYQPHLLFTLRGVDPQELITADLALPGDSQTGAQTLADDQLADVFGIEMDEAAPAVAAEVTRDVISSGGPKTRKKSKGAVQKKSAVIVTRTAAQTRKKARRTTLDQTSGSSGSGRVKRKRQEKLGRRAMALTGRSIVRLRRQAGLTQAQFAGTLGVSKASVARWEATAGRLTLQSRCLASLTTLKNGLEG